MVAAGRIREVTVPVDVDERLGIDAFPGVLQMERTVSGARTGVFRPVVRIGWPKGERLADAMMQKILKMR